MDINQVLTEYDNMFGRKDLSEIEAYLAGKIDEAYAEQDYASAVTLLNEIIGFCRDTTQKEKGMAYCEQNLKLMLDLGLEGTVEYATSLINIANACRAFGRWEEALALFRKVEEIYEEKLPGGEFNYASLYNNWSLLYQEMQDFSNARLMLEKALKVVEGYPDKVFQLATTYSNLALSLLHLCRQKESKEQKTDGQEETPEQLYALAITYLKRALAIHEKDGGRDFHYGAVLSAMGDALFFHQEYTEAAIYYKKTLRELEKHVGHTKNYERVAENLILARKLAGGRSKNLDRCRTFYMEAGAAMIRDKFPEYEQRIAVGMVGEGSDCFGYDDGISADHDYGIGFCMWLLPEDYQKIGAALQKEYEKLVLEYKKQNHEDDSLDLFLGQRRGVFEIDHFYEMLLGIRMPQEKENAWQQLPEERLATAVNGEVFRDDSGYFTSVRSRLLGYYSDEVWKQRLAVKLHDFSQYAQSNYARMMARKDYVTAKICIAEGMKAAMELCYLLNRTYAPYYKWMREGLKELSRLQTVGEKLDRISSMKCQVHAWENVAYNSAVVNEKDEVIVLFDQIAGEIAEELVFLGLVSADNIPKDHTDNNAPFLENYCRELLTQETESVREQEETVERKEQIMTKEEYVEKIVSLEWKQFDKVENEGGRADCQDDWNTFSIMRKSQYLTWNEELLASYYQDLIEAEEKGWNLIMEKYARMMKSTAPEKYASLEKNLPVRSEERIAIQEEIIKLQVGWMEAFAEKYPKMAGNARSIHTSEDTPYNTSYETYLRGELGTYSEETLVLYGRFVVALQQAGKNLAYEIMSNTARLYGYESVEDAERRL